MSEEELLYLTGNFKGWEYVSLFIGVAFLLLSILSLHIFLKRKKDNLFSYRTVAYLGFFFFFLILAVFRIDYFLRYGDEGTFSLLLVSLVFSGRSFVIASIPITAFIALGLIVSNVMLIKRAGIHPYNMYASLIALTIIAANAIALYIEMNSTVLLIPNAVKNIWYLLYCYFSAMYLSVIVCGVIAAKRTPSFDKDYVIILGCQVGKDGKLLPVIEGRVKRAMDFVNEQSEQSGKDAVFLPSGGKGNDEQLSEGEAMKRYLLEHGIDDSHIKAETNSTTTYENMVFSKKLINDDTKKVAFATSSFHVFRSGILASSIGWNIDGMGAPNKWYYWPNAFMREFLGLLGESWKQQIVLIAIIASLAVFLTSLL